MPHPVIEEWDATLRGGDPLAFPGYGPVDPESVRTGRTEHYAVIEGRFDVLGGSMGAVHGERVVRAYRQATDARLPVVVLASSGGARMQEGMVSLVQMARTAAASRAHAAAGLLQIAVLRSPTTGGVYASYASLADIRFADRGATIGFAGPRVVEQTLGITMPAGSHTAESALAAGVVDAVIDPSEEAAAIESALGLRAIPFLSPVPTAQVGSGDRTRGRPARGGKCCGRGPGAGDGDRPRVGGVRVVGGVAGGRSCRSGRGGDHRRAAGRAWWPTTGTRATDDPARRGSGWLGVPSRSRVALVCRW